ncbi:MAG: oligoendopeptidase F [Trueperaceae bacterium]|nr:oligoendopeptidase F [Trueperaceae bacterium]
MATITPDRADVPKEERWNAESVFATPAGWDEAYETLKQDLDLAKGFQGTLNQGINQLLRWLNYSNNIIRELRKLSVYAVMDYSTNSLDKGAASRYDRYRDLNALVSEAFAFSQPEIIGIGFEVIKGWMELNSDLALYKHYFTELEQSAKHTRSAEVEALLGAVQSPFANATASHGVLANTDLRFEAAKDSEGESFDITQSTINSLLHSPDRRLRQSAYENYADAHLQYKNTMASLLSTGIKQNNFIAKAKRYDSALHMALAPLNLPYSVFHNLIDTFKANLPTWHRYWHAKRKMLEVSELHPYDIAAPMTENRPSISFEQSVAWLKAALAPLGDDYVNTLERGSLEEGWVDRSLNKGKRMGAFSTSAPDTHSFIMMSYTPDVFGMSTLAHELGHSMHSYFSNGAQPTVYARYSLFAAEVASNFNQAVLRDYLFKQQTDRDFQIALIEEAMANFYRYFLVMPTLARFELELHERSERGQSLSADSLNELMADLFAEAYGDMVLDRERLGITWAQFHTHIYSRFYVYQYATGISGAHALAKGIIAGDENAASKYLTFLKAGGSRYPLDALKDAGVDLSSPQAVEETFAVLGSLVDRLEQLSET